MQNPLKNIPSVHELLESEPLKKLIDNVSHNVSRSRKSDRFWTTCAMMSVRRRPMSKCQLHQNWLRRSRSGIVTDQQPKLRPVINATGILLHTGLGRAPLPAAAIAAINEISGGYASVEVDLESGHRSQRVQSVYEVAL